VVLLMGVASGSFILALYLVAYIAWLRIPCNNCAPLPLLDYHAVDLVRDFAIVDGDVGLRDLAQDCSVRVYPARPYEDG